MQRKGTGDSPDGSVDTAMFNQAPLPGVETRQIVYVGDNSEMIARVSALLEATPHGPYSLIQVSSVADARRRDSGQAFLAALIQPFDDEQQCRVLTEEIRVSLPTLPVVLLSDDADRGAAQAAALGAECFVLNAQSSGHDLGVALRCAMERQQREDNVRATAYSDPITGVACSALFNDRLRQGVIRAQRTAESLAVMVVDFTKLAAGGGMDAGVFGNTMLRTVSERLSRLVREGDTVARLGSERFGIVMEGMRNERKSLLVAEKILQTALKPIAVGKQKFAAQAVVGVAVFPEQASSAGELLERAIAAADQARRLGGNRCCLCSLECSAHEREVADELGVAASDHQFRVFYQPYIDLESSRIAGVEALLRWKHPERGLLPPQEFLSHSEQSGLINQIGRWILLTACRQMRQWSQEGLLNVPVSVNVSTRQLLTPGFQGMVESVLRETGVDPRMLILEIPPDLQHRQAIACATPLRALRELGVRVALDDFGGEGRALASVHDIAADIWKIDELFVQRSVEDDVNSAILSSLVELGRRLNVEIIAKGVESNEQLENLRMHGVDAVQGLALCAPMPAPNVHKWVQSLQAA